MFEIRPIERPVGVFTNNDANTGSQPSNFREANPENTPFTDIPKVDTGQGCMA